MISPLGSDYGSDDDRDVSEPLHKRKWEAESTRDVPVEVAIIAIEDEIVALPHGVP